MGTVRWPRSEIADDVELDPAGPEQQRELPGRGVSARKKPTCMAPGNPAPGGVPGTKLASVGRCVQNSGSRAGDGRPRGVPPDDIANHGEPRIWDEINASRVVITSGGVAPQRTRTAP